MNMKTGLTAVLTFLAILTSEKSFATVYYADAGALNDGNLYVDIPTNMTNIRGVYIIGKRGDMDTAFWGPRTNAWQPFLNSFGFVVGYRTQGEAQCAADRDVPQKTMQSMASVAALSGHPELAYAPVFIFGFSADAAGAAAMPEVYPERTLGSVWHSTADNCTYGDPESQTNELFYTPTMEISCANDGYGWQMVHTWTTMSNWVGRVITGSVAWVHTQQGGGHGAAMDRTTLQFPWILSVLSQRMPADTTPYTNYPALSRLNTNLLWHGDQGPRGLFWMGSYWSNFDSNGASRTVGSFKIWPATNAPPGGLSDSPTWSALPDEAFARVWQTYCDLTNAAVAPSGNDAALAIQTVALMPIETRGVEESGKKLKFAVVRSRVSPGSLNVGFTLSGTASNGADYAAVTNFICTIPANEWAGYIELSPTDDLTAEGSESVTVTLLSNTNSFWVHSGGSVTAEISDDETSAPVVTALSPLNGESSFIGTNLIMTFSRQMSKGLGFITISNLTDHMAVELLDVSSPRVAVNGTTITIGLTNYLTGPKSYAVLMPSGVFQDTQGHKFSGMASTSDWHFVARSYDTNAPLVVSMWPTNNAGMFNRFEDIRLTFNEKVMAGSGMIVISNLTLNRNVERIPVGDTTRVFFSGSNMTVRSTNPLAQSNLFCVSIEPGVIVDTFPPAPNPFAGLTNTTAWRFATKADLSAFTETFDNENAVSDPFFNNNQYGAFGGVSNVQYSWYKIFSATGSGCQLIDGSAVVLESPNGGASQITTEFLPNIGTLGFQLLKAVATNTKTARVQVNTITRSCVTNSLILYYDYSGTGVNTVNAGAVPVKEPVRVQIAKMNGDMELTLDNVVWTLYAPIDTNPPAPVFLPSNGDIMLPTTQVFVVRFNEEITAANGSPMSSALAASALYLTNKLTGANVPFTAVFDYEFGLPQITMTPDAPLDSFTSYELGFKAGSVRDLSGNTNTIARALLTTAPATRSFRESFKYEGASTNANYNLWTGGSFVGDEGVSWNYTVAGSASYASGAYRIHEKGLILRAPGNTGLVSTVDVPGGVGSFMLLFRNGSSSAGARKVALDISGQHYESAAVDSSEPVLFRVDGINAVGNENTYNTITISNAAANTLVTIDSIVWTAYKDPLRLVAQTGSVAVAEGGTGSVNIRLNRFPENTVTATVQQTAGSTNVTTTATTFMLNEGNWNTGYTVLFSSGEDTDVLNNMAQFAVSSPDAIATNITVIQTDNDTGPEISASSLLVREGTNNSFQIRLTKQPVADTTVSVVRVSGDADLSVDGTSVFQFTTGNWASWQTAYIRAGLDSDATDGTALFSIASTGVDPVLLTAAERDAAWTNWIAYHDMSTNAIGDAAVVTKGFVHGTAYALTNALTAEAVSNVTLTFRYYDKNGAEKPASITQSATTILDPTAGTHAAQLFGGYVKPDVVYQVALTTDYAVVTIDGLQPDRKYGIGLFINRGTFTPRTRFTLQNATNFMAAGSLGIGDCGDNNPATYEVEVNNSTRGYVAMWTNITPTGNGGASFSVRQDNFPNSTGTVLRLAQAVWITGEMPPTNTAAAAEQFILSVQGTIGGSVNPTGGVYNAGAVVQISATASSYWHFVAWTGDVASVATPLDVSISTNITVYAQFAENLQTNGTPQRWLAEHGLGTTDADALSDTDGDGMAAWEEYIAGTLPNLGSSVFKISNHWKNESGRVMVWPTVAGRVYSVYWSSNLTSGVWSQMTVSAQGGYTDAVHAATDRGFYKINVQMVP